MRILLINSFSGLGGAETHVSRLTWALMERGHEVHVGSPAPGPLVDEVTAAGARHHPVTMFPHRPSPAQVLRLREIISAVDPQIVHLHGTRAALLGRAALLPGRLPLVGGGRRGVACKRTDFMAPAVVYTVHGAHFLHYRPPLDRVGAGVERTLESLATDATIFVSRADLAACVAAGASAGRRCVVVRNGIEPVEAICPQVRAERRREVRAELGASEDAVLWLAVGRLSPPKDYPTMLRAMAEAAPAMASGSMLLAVAGGGSEKERLHLLAAELGLGGLVHFLGARSGVPRLMDAADGLVMSSAWEGLPYVALEAMTHRLPVVATRVGGVMEAVEDGVSGRLVPPGDPSALARAILDLNADSAQRRSMGEAGARRVARRFNEGRMVEETLQVYRRALAWRRVT